MIKNDKISIFLLPAGFRLRWDSSPGLSIALNPNHYSSFNYDVI